MLWLLWKLHHRWVVTRKTHNHWNLKEAQSLGETRCKKFWYQFDEYDSHSLRHVKQVSGKIKDHRLEKNLVRIPHPRSPNAMKFEETCQEEIERQERCARGDAWRLAKNIYKLEEGTKLHSTHPRKNGYCRLHQQKSWRKESLWKTLTLPNWRPWGYRGILRRWRPTARCKQENRPLYVSKNYWTYPSRWCFLEKHPQFFCSGSSPKIMGILTTRPAVENHISPKIAKNIKCSFSNYVPFVVPGLSTSSSTSSSPTSSTSPSQDSAIGTENPATEWSETMSEELRRNPLQEPAETENTNKNEDDEELQGGILRDLPVWLQEFRENLVDECVPTESRRNPSHEHRDTSSSSHEWPMESRAKVELGSGKHSSYTHFPKDPKCDVCLKTKMTRASCRRRAGTVVSRAESLCGLTTCGSQSSQWRKWIT